MKKRFIFDENYIKRYAKKDKMRWVVIGGCALILLIVVIIVVIATKSRVKPTPTPSVEFELKQEIVVEAGSTLPEVADYFTKLENLNLEDVKITYPAEFDISYDLARCNDDDLDKINNDKNVDMSKFSCAIPILKIPTIYGITLNILDKDYTVNLKVEDTTPPVVLTNNVEIYEGEEYELADFINACYDENDICDVSYVEDDTDENGNPINYANYKEPGEYTIRLKAIDGFENESDVIETELKIVKVEEQLFDISFNSSSDKLACFAKTSKGLIPFSFAQL